MDQLLLDSETLLRMIPGLPPRPDRPQSEEILPCQEISLPPNVELLTTEDIQHLLQQREKLKDYSKKFNDSALSNVVDESAEWRKDSEELLKAFEALSGEKKELKSQLDVYKKLEFDYLKKWQDLDHIISNKFDNEALKKQLRHKIIDLDEKSSRMVNEIPVNDESLDVFLEQFILERTDYHLQREKLATWEYQDILKKP